MTTETKRAALYLRLSDDKKKTGENVADQERGGRELAKSRGLTVVAVYSDNSRPASDPEHQPRPEFERLMADAETGLFDAVICRHADRLYRHPIDQLRVSSTFGPRKITIHQEWSGYPLDLSTPTGVLNAGIAAQVALYEIQHKKERQRATNDALLKAGKPQPGGPRPFGFNRDMTPNLAEATEVGLATQAVLSGVSLGAIIRDWNERGITATRGGKWGYSSMRTLLLRWSNAGIRQRTITDPVTRKKTVVEHGAGTWEGFISEADFRALKAKLEDPARIRHRGETGRKHLLSHILKCGKCQSPLRASHTTTRAGLHYMMYQCSGSGCRLGIDYDTAERVVIRAVASRLAMPSPSMLALTADERKKAGDAHTRLTQITEDEQLIEESKISAASKIRQLESLQTEREHLENIVSGIGQRMALAAMMQDQIPVISKGKASLSKASEAMAEALDRFEGLDLDRKRELIRSLFSVSVEPSLKGVRPTKETAAKRLVLTRLDPATGQPEQEESEAA
ncbi:recombinase family protein [Nocardioides jensenii]|uniref:recombinase family protein n=1 Tax=Nocardioides jensenii TaxID=1843 RepID=UPI00082B2597|nr:recombinase family protein [Nocardioides jensenii]